MLLFLYLFAFLVVQWSAIWLPQLIWGATLENITEFPFPTTGYTPKRSYHVSKNIIWENVLSVLEYKRIDLIMENKSNGRITTDHVTGPIESMGFAGALGSIATRYKYIIYVKPTSQSKTCLTVNSHLESRSVTESSSTWHDISVENKQRIELLETWVYEQIEKELVNKDYISDNSRGTSKNSRISITNFNYSPKITFTQEVLIK